jgi:hypothetical protein
MGFYTVFLTPFEKFYCLDRKQEKKSSHQKDETERTSKIAAICSIPNGRGHSLCFASFGEESL